MNTSLTDITVILDRSGSMYACQSDAEEGLNAFVAEQRKLEGECLFTLVEFNHDYNFFCKGIPVSDVPYYKLIPSGMTALMDAVGRAINETGIRLSQMLEQDRPALVIFAILTDGQENSSKEFSRTQVKEMIERQTKDYDWQFTFLGANQDAFSEAANIGINQQAVANFSTKKSSQAFASVASNVGRMRSASKIGASFENSYTANERSQMN